MEQVSLSWGMLAELLGMKCGPLCSSIFPKCLVKRSFGGSLDTMFCLHAAGGIYVNDNFANSGGKIEISGSSASYAGGAVLRSSSCVFGTIEMAVGSRRSTLGSEIRKRIEEISIDFHSFHQCWRQSLIANWFKS